MKENCFLYNDKFEICINDIIIEPRQVIFSNNYRGGGGCVNLTRVINNFDGFPYPNHYRISLRKNFYNVKKVELISSIFPNTERVFRDKPVRGGSKKFYVYTKNESGNVVKVSFGDPNMEIKKDNPARRKSFRARHNCADPGPSEASPGQNRCAGDRERCVGCVRCNLFYACSVTKPVRK